MPGSFPSSAFFSSGKLFHGMYGHDESMFRGPLSMFYPVLSLEEAPTFCSLFIRGSIQIVSMILYVVQTNFLHYRSLICKSLVIVEVKLEEIEREKQRRTFSLILKTVF